MAETAWSRRNKLARSKGYKDYYDYRAHDYGRVPASQPKARGETLARLRGHRSATDFEKLVGSGRVWAISQFPTRRDAKGRILEAQFIVSTIEREKGREVMRDRVFMLRGRDLAKGGKIDRLRRLVLAAGVDVYGNYDLLAPRAGEFDISEEAA